MRRISVIGAGQAGLMLAHSLVRQGYEVTLYADRTADQWLTESRPTGTAYLYAESLDIERELGIDHWSDTMHAGHGFYTSFASPTGDAPMNVIGRTQRPGGAVDQRLKFHRWMIDLERCGGHIVIESVTAARAQEIAAASDLTILAAGKGDIGKLIPRDAQRSVYSAPQRHIAMVTVRGVRGWDDEIGFTPVRFTALGPVGDIFWVPFTHKTAGSVWSAVIEARPGGPLDMFAACSSGEQAAARLKQAIQQLAPWSFAPLAGMEYVSEDPFAWLAGVFAPSVRSAFGTLPSGDLLMPLGDTAITFDPIGGQGGNNASRHAQFVAQAIVAHADRPFDAQWMKSTCDAYWEFHGRYAYRFNNLMLEPPTPSLMELMAACSSDRDLADGLFVANIARPKGFFPWIEDIQATRDVIERFNARAGSVRGPTR